MIKNLILLILIYFAYKTIKKWMLTTMEDKGGDLSQPGEQGGADDLMIKDPQCGVYFPKRDSVRLKSGNETLHFCSEKCRDEYNEKL